MNIQTQPTVHFALFPVVDNGALPALHLVIRQFDTEDSKNFKESRFALLADPKNPLRFTGEILKQPMAITLTVDTDRDGEERPCHAALIEWKGKQRKLWAYYNADGLINRWWANITERPPVTPFDPKTLMAKPKPKRKRPAANQATPVEEVLADF